MISGLISRWREFTLAVIITMSILLASEYGLRYLLFSDIPIARSLRNPGLFADNNCDDDYWKLWALFHPVVKPLSSEQLHPKRFDPTVGYVNATISRRTYVHHAATEINGRVPVLLYGDSYAECNVPEKDCFQGILNTAPSFADQHYLINYGVGGYGLDQIYLLYKRSIENYDSPVVIFGFLEHDMDRAILKFRQVPKPYFELNDGQLKLKGVPVESSKEDYLLRNPPEINSYLWRLLTHGVLPIPWASLNTAKKKEIAKAILLEVSRDLKARNIRHLFLVFQPINPPGSAPSWREEFLTEFFDKNGLEYMLTQRIVEQHVSEKDFDRLNYVISKDDMHPNRRVNAFVANALSKWLNEGSIGIAQRGHITGASFCGTNTLQSNGGKAGN